MSYQGNAGSPPTSSNNRPSRRTKSFFPFSSKYKSVLGSVVTLLLLELNPFRETGSQGGAPRGKPVVVLRPSVILPFSVRTMDAPCSETGILHLSPP